MKFNIIIITLLLLLSPLKIIAQIGLGGLTKIDGISTIMQFNGNTYTQNPNDNTTTNTLGIILPSVDVCPNFSNNNANNGTFLFDATTKKVKMFENGIWIDLSDGPGSIDNIILNNNQDKTNVGVIIGSSSTDAEGVLIIESTNKALILPHIQDPHINVKNPYPGMMCYDTTSNSLAVFDGIKWNYWK